MHSARDSNQIESSKIRSNSQKYVHAVKYETYAISVYTYNVTTMNNFRPVSKNFVYM